MGNKNQKNKDSIYCDYVKKVMSDVYKEKIRPLKSHYCKAVLTLYRKNPDYYHPENETEEQKKERYKQDMRTIHTSVYRALKRLHREGVMYLIDNKYYVPLDDYNKDEVKAKISKIRFLRDDVLEISPNVCLIRIEAVELDEAKELFTKFIGIENLYSISKLDDSLLIAVKCSADIIISSVYTTESNNQEKNNKDDNGDTIKTKKIDTEEEIIANIKDLIKDAYIKQHEKHEKYGYNGKTYDKKKSVSVIT